MKLEEWFRFLSFVLSLTLSYDLSFYIYPNNIKDKRNVTFYVSVTKIFNKERKKEQKVRSLTSFVESLKKEKIKVKKKERKKERNKETFDL